MDNEENRWFYFRSACVEAAREVCGESTGIRHIERDLVVVCGNERSYRRKKHSF